MEAWGLQDDVLRLLFAGCYASALAFAMLAFVLLINNPQREG